jgi:urea transport system substrate-binding protein
MAQFSGHKGLALALTLLTVVLSLAVGIRFFYKPPIRIGVMHSQTGHLAANEIPLIEAIVLAVDELNSDPENYLLGRKIEVVLKDGSSNDEIFQKVAGELMVEDVDVVFGCWSSSCRRHVIPIFEEHNHLLYYALQYEGVEDSANVIFLGAVPNQQIIPALEYAFGQKRKRIYLIGTDYIFPYTANQTINTQATKWGGEIVGVDYVAFDATDFVDIVKDIRRVEPDVIFNTINGPGNAAFFRELRKQGVTSADIPSFSFSITEDELARMGDTTMAGDYVVWSYLQELDTDENEAFIGAFRKKYGEKRVLGGPMAMAYTSVLLWAEAVKKADSSAVDEVRAVATDISIMGPAGMLYVEDSSRHSWKTMYVAQIREDHSLHEVWSSSSPIQPQPFYGRDPEDWKQFIGAMYDSWNQSWGAAPESPVSDLQ